MAQTASIAAPRLAPFTELQPVERRTLPAIFFHGIDRHGDRDAVLVKSGGAWTAVSHADVLRRVALLAEALAGLGLEKGDRVAILSENRIEWAVADYAALALGLVDVPIYPTLPADQVLHILRDAGVRVAFASTAEQWKKIAAVRAELPGLDHVVGFDAPAGTDGVTALADLLAAPLDSAGGDGDDLEARLRGRAHDVRPDDVATLIYTSGTTGLPKGVMLTHDNLAAMVAATHQHGSLPLEPGDVALSFLPLSHIFERAVDYYYWDAGVAIAYAESTSKVAANMREVRPHTMVSVPRVFDMIYASVMSATGAKRRLIDRAVRAGGAVADGAIELQGDLRDRLRPHLLSKGFIVKG